MRILIIFLILISCRPQFSIETHEFNFQKQQQKKFPISDVYSVDFNSDGLNDLFITHLMWPPKLPPVKTGLSLFQGLADGRFKDVSKKWVKDIQTIHPRHLIESDLNGDLKNDYIIADHGVDLSPFPGKGPILLIQKDNKFITMEKKYLEFKSPFSFNSSVADIDNDGDKDIFLINFSVMANKEHSTLYLNNGEGFDKSIKNLPPIVTENHKAFLSCLFEDIDNDGDPDLILGGGGINSNIKLKRDIVLFNDGKGNFKNLFPKALPLRKGGTSWSTVDIKSADLDNDGWKDLVLLTHNSDFSKGAIQIIYNQKNNYFQETNQNLNLFPIKKNFWIPWVSLGDINADGRKDIALTFRMSGSSKIKYKKAKFFKVFLNSEEKGFLDISNSIELPNLWFSSTHFIDIDGDDKDELIFTDYDGKYYLVRPQRGLFKYF